MDLKLLLFLPFAIAFIYLSFRRPGLAILFFLSAKFSLDRVAQFTLDSSFFHSAAAIITLIGCCIIIFRSPGGGINQHLRTFIIFLLLANLVSAVWGLINSHFHFFALVNSPIRLNHALAWFGKVLSIIIPLLLGIHIQSPDLNFRRILIAIVIGTIPASITGLTEIILNLIRLENISSLQWAASWRISGGFHGPGTLGFTMLIGLCCAYYLLFFNLLSKKLYNYLLVAYGILSYIVLTCTITRISWLSLIFFFLILQFRSNAPIRVQTFLIFIVLIFNPIMLSRFNKEFTYVFSTQVNKERPLSFNQLGSGRIWLWKDALAHYSKLDPVSKAIGSGGYFGSHNQYIAWLLRNGAIGLLIWLYFLFLIARFCVNKKFHQSFIFALFFMITLVTNMFSHPWDNFNISFIFWLLIGVFMNKHLAHDNSESM